MATCEIAAAPSARAHHHVGDPTAKKTAAVRTRAAARPRAPRPEADRFGELRNLGPPEALGDSEKVEEAVAREHSDEHPAQRGGHADHLFHALCRGRLCVRGGAWTGVRGRSRGSRWPAGCSDGPPGSRAGRRQGSPTTTEASSIPRMSAQGTASVVKSLGCQSALQGHAEAEAEDGAEEGAEHRRCDGLDGDHAAQLSTPQPDRAEQPDLAGPLEDGEGEGVDDAENGDDDR